MLTMQIARKNVLKFKWNYEGILLTYCVHSLILSAGIDCIWWYYMNDIVIISTNNNESFCFYFDVDIKLCGKSQSFSLIATKSSVSWNIYVSHLRLKFYWLKNAFNNLLQLTKNSLKFHSIFCFLIERI